MDKEHQISFHIMLLTAFTVLSLLLDIIIVISGWGSFAVLPVTGALLLCWIVHLAKIGTDDQRMYLYVVMMLGILGYYAFQGSTITDVPILLCLLIIMLSRKSDNRLIYLVSASYLVYLFGNLLFTDYLWEHAEQIVFSRIVLGIVCLASACFISVNFIRQYESVVRELSETKEQLLLAKKENELFLSNMSHELRTPINAVNGVSEILLADRLPEDKRKDVRVIRSAGRRLYRQISDVLDFSEIETGHFSLSCDEYEPVSVIHDAVAMVFEERRESVLDFAIDVELTLPKVLYGDAERLKKLLVCLMDNSLKFTDVGGAYLHITGRREHYGINLNVDLWDTGCGIEEKELQRLFNGSSPGDSSAERRKGGLGLGLAIAHGIISSMHGFLSIDSIPGEGTHIHASIPQEVRSAEPSFELEHPEKYHAVCYFNREKYVRPEIGAYYFQIIEHIQRSFGIDVTLAASLEEVKELCAAGGITHLYIAEWEYRVEPEFFDKMAGEMEVCVFADRSFSPSGGSFVDVIYKPVFILAVINHLRRTMPGISMDELRVVKQQQKELDMGSGFRALVVDDEEMNLIVAKGILESFGMSADVCGSGELAIEKCSIADYDIIFMDYMMPKMNGTKAMKRIREVRNRYYKDKPIIVFTANAVSGAKEAFLAEGFDDFIAKPIEIKQLRKLLEKFLTEGTR